MHSDAPVTAAQHRMPWMTASREVSPAVSCVVTHPPTNKAVTGRGSYIARFRDGKVVEFRSHPDVAGLMMQLGFMPPM